MADSQPAGSSTGFKLTFKLNGSSSTPTSAALSVGAGPAAVASTSSSSASSSTTGQPLPIVQGSPKFSAAPSLPLESSPAPSDAPSSVAGTPAAGPSTGTPTATDGKPAPKKRSRKSGVEPGPGKHWRKGLKGNITGGVRLTEAPPGVTAGAGVAKRSSAATSKSVGSLAVAPAPKIAANTYLAAQTFDAKTPAPRKWTAKPREILTITGMKVELRAWFGDPKSAFAESISSRIMDETRLLEGVENSSAVDSRIASPAPAAAAAAASSSAAAPAKKKKRARPSTAGAAAGTASGTKTSKKAKRGGEGGASTAATPSRANSVSEQGQVPVEGVEDSKPMSATPSETTAQVPVPKEEAMDVDASPALS